MKVLKLNELIFYTIIMRPFYSSTITKAFDLLCNTDDFKNTNQKVF
jgi:hypothetical protein